MGTSSMENYVKGEEREVEDKVDLPFQENVIHMKVASGSKIRNVMGYAMKQMKDPAIKQITWNGSGTGTSKTITCAEIMKRKMKGLHQITNVRFKRIEEYWDPKQEGLERLRVNRDIPAITVLLSKEPLDTTIPGYQPPGSFDAFWKKGTVSSASTGRDKNGRRPNRGAGVSTDSPAYGTLTKKKRKRGQGKEAASGGQQGPETPLQKKDNRQRSGTESVVVESMTEVKTETDNTTDAQVVMDS